MSKFGKFHLRYGQVGSVKMCDCYNCSFCRKSCWMIKPFKAEKLCKYHPLRTIRGKPLPSRGNQRVSALGTSVLSTIRSPLYSHIFLQKLVLDCTDCHSRPRKLSTPMSYLADHIGCRGRAGSTRPNLLLQSQEFESGGHSFSFTYYLSHTQG